MRKSSVDGDYAGGKEGEGGEGRLTLECRVAARVEQSCDQVEVGQSKVEFGLTDSLRTFSSESSATLELDAAL